MTTTTLFEGLPEIYRAFLPADVFAASIPEETKATCSSCAMCESTCGSLKLSTTEKPGKPGLFFSPDTKCCTYHPSLPNYLVGAILRDQTPEMARGRAHMEAKIEKRQGVTPYGISAPPKYNLLYSNSREFFGRSTDMLCPYYISESGGLCSIWRHRESVCSTYFCKYEAGADGRRFYGSLKSYLALLERQLSRLVIRRLYPDYLIESLHPSEPPERRLEREELEDRPLNDVFYGKVWGEWMGFEQAFFEEAFDIVQALKPNDLGMVLGIDGEVSQDVLMKHLRAMTAPTLPKRVKLNTDLTVRHEGDEVILGAYSELDALALSATAFDLLQEFKQEEDVTTVRTRLRRDRQSDFADEVLLSLYQHRVLLEV